MKILWDERAWEDYLLWQTQDKKTLKRINALIKDIQRDTYKGMGKPEPLLGNLRKYRIIRVVGWRVNFPSGAPANFAGLLAASQGKPTQKCRQRRRNCNEVSSQMRRWDFRNTP